MEYTFPIWSDDVMSISRHRHVFIDQNSLRYEIYVASFNLTQNPCSDDMAFVSISHNGKTYANVPAMLGSTCDYARIDYILTNDAGWRAWKAIANPPWTHAHVEIREINIRDKHMEWVVIEGLNNTPLERYSFYEV